MKVLSIHNFHYIAGGADRCYMELNELLDSRGHTVIPFSTKDRRNNPSKYSEYFTPRSALNVSNPKLSKLNLTQAKAFVNMLYSFPAKRCLEKLLNLEKPDVAHLHNIYGRISPSILPLLKKYGIPIVQTLHDTKIVCPNHRMFVNGAVCEECIGGKYYKSISKKCCHGSRLLGVALSIEAYVHSWLNIYQKHVDAFISPSKFLKDILVQHGIDSRKIFVIPNFVRDVDEYHSFNLPEQAFDGLFFGSLIPEKGVEVLIRSLAGLKKGKFRIVGDGPERTKLEKMARDIVPASGPSIGFTGHLTSDQLKKEILKSLFVIVPSIWYENCPMAVMEAFSQGKPVVGSRAGGIPELIIEGKTGLLFKAGDSDDLGKKISELMKDRGRAIQMGVNARRWVRDYGNPDVYLKKLMTLYETIGVSV